MQCDQLERRINHHLDRRNDPRCDAEISVHVANCQSCGRLIRGYEALLLGVDLVAGDLGAGAEPEERFVERTVQTVCRPSRAWGRQLKLLAMGLAAALLIALGPTLLSRIGSFDATDDPRQAPVRDVAVRDELPTQPENDLLPELLPEDVAKIVLQVTGRELASLPQTVRRVATHPETDRLVGHIRPLTEPMSATWDALMRTLPDAPSTPSNPETDTGYVQWTKNTIV
jgi:hypothetical protein